MTRSMIAGTCPRSRIGTVGPGVVRSGLRFCRVRPRGSGPVAVLAGGGTDGLPYGRRASRPAVEFSWVGHDDHPDDGHRADGLGGGVAEYERTRDSWW